MKVHVGVRPAGWSFYEPYCDYWESPFYRGHPEWRCVDRDGTPVARMSWAVPEVRRHMIELLREQVRFGADGANIVFNRGYPVVLYEPAAAKLFQEKYGADPRTVPESDPRITRWWSDVVTTFLPELRAMLDEEQKARADGKRLQLSVIVLGTAQDDLRFGVDLRRLAEEKLIDEISAELGFGRSTNTFNLSLLSEISRARGIPFYPGDDLRARMVRGNSLVLRQRRQGFGDVGCRRGRHLQLDLGLAFRTLRGNALSTEEPETRRSTADDPPLPPARRADPRRPLRAVLGRLTDASP